MRGYVRVSGELMKLKWVSSKCKIGNKGDTRYNSGRKGGNGVN